MAYMSHSAAALVVIILVIIVVDGGAGTPPPSSLNGKWFLAVSAFLGFCAI